ncbi:MFS transporter [Acetobacter okinawensis]|uniref:MFS transporter n=1 Tax=Acetobacter okinawensis TaxID=1076594 RepID=UPI0006878449|nr:MFS transporter [Acetobacter okinawensis]
MTTQLAAPVQSAQKGALSAIFLAVFLAVLDYAVANIALPTIGQDLHTSASVSIWVVNAYQLVNCMLLLPLATFAERVGAKSVCIGGLLVLVVGSVICSLANQLWVLALARGIQGAGGAAIMAVNTALVRMVCPPARLGHSLALNALITSLAVAVGPSVAGGFFTSPVHGAGCFCLTCLWGCWPHLSVLCICPAPRELNAGLINPLLYSTC